MWHYAYSSSTAVLVPPSNPHPSIPHTLTEFCWCAGCSKTTLARAAATASKASLFPLSGAQLYSMYVGEGEALLRGTFKMARQAAPSIIFLDEVDSLAGNSPATAMGLEAAQPLQCSQLAPHRHNRKVFGLHALDSSALVCREEGGGGGRGVRGACRPSPPVCPPHRDGWHGAGYRYLPLRPLLHMWWIDASFELQLRLL